MNVAADVQTLLRKAGKAENDKNRLLSSLRQLNLASLAAGLASREYVQSKLANIQIRADVRTGGVDVVVSFTHIFPVSMVGPVWFICVNVRNMFTSQNFEVSRQLSESEFPANATADIVLTVPATQMAFLPWAVDVSLLFSPLDLFQSEDDVALICKRIPCIVAQPVTVLDLISRRESAHLVPPLCHFRSLAEGSNDLTAQTTLHWTGFPESAWPNPNSIGSCLKYVGAFGTQVDIRISRNNSDSGLSDVAYSSTDHHLLKQVSDALFTLHACSMKINHSKWSAHICETTSKFFPTFFDASMILASDQLTLQSYADSLLSLCN